MAINRLGMGYAADLATGLAMAQMFQATTDLIDQRMPNAGVGGSSPPVATIYQRACMDAGPFLFLVVFPITALLLQKVAFRGFIGHFH